MQLIMGLSVSLSNIPEAGCGLKAKKPNAAWAASAQTMKNAASATRMIAGRLLVFAPGEWISPYTGDRLTFAQEQARYDNHGSRGRYLYELNATTTIDSIRTNNAPARFANHSTAATEKNAEFATRTLNGTTGIWLRARKRIFDGDEIKASYGPHYQFQEGLYPDEVPVKRLC